MNGNIIDIDILRTSSRDDYRNDDGIWRRVIIFIFVTLCDNDDRHSDTKPSSFDRRFGLNTFVGRCDPSHSNSFHTERCCPD